MSKENLERQKSFIFLHQDFWFTYCLSASTSESLLKGLLGTWWHIRKQGQNGCTCMVSDRKTLRQIQGRGKRRERQWGGEEKHSEQEEGKTTFKVEREGGGGPKSNERERMVHRRPEEFRGLCSADARKLHTRGLYLFSLLFITCFIFQLFFPETPSKETYWLNKNKARTKIFKNHESPPRLLYPWPTLLPQWLVLWAQRNTGDLFLYKI